MLICGVMMLLTSCSSDDNNDNGNNGGGNTTPPEVTWEEPTTDQMAVAERVCQFVDRCGTHQTSAESDGHLYERHGNGVAIGTYTIKVKKSDNSLVTSGYTINVVAYSAGGGGYDPDDDAGQD